MAEHDAIERLKADWRSDRTWDVEDTPGFEAHHATLLDFRKTLEEQESAADLRRLELRAKELGCPGNVALVRHLEWMSRRISELEVRVIGAC